jgi:uncharacterized membrane protein YdbT with pleckstrin-like domain
MRDRRRCVVHPGRVPFPDRLLTDDEEVVRHLHPHALAVVRPVLVLLVLVGAASFTAAALPAGPHQGALRSVVTGAAVVLGLVLGARPLLRWAATHYVLTTGRLLVRRGVLVRRGRDLPLSRITEVGYRQTPGQRLLRSGTVVVETGGDAAVVLDRVPRCETVVALLHDLLLEDDLRRDENSWEGDPWDEDPWDGDPWDDGATAVHAPR